MCAYVCVNTQPYFQSGTAWPPLRVFLCSHQGACTVDPFSPVLSPQHLVFLLAGLLLSSLSSILSDPVGISNNHSAHWVGVF